MVSCAFGQQIPNGDFETWNSLDELTPEGYKSIGLVSSSTDSKVGSTALRLENKKKTGTNLFGAITNTSFDSGFAYGGIPYEERPLSLNFWAKYDLAAGDKAHIICYFKSEARVMGIINFQIEGNSSGQFVEYSVPITWYSVGIPDSVTFFASSTSLYSNFARGDGFIILDDVHFKTIYNRNEALHNGDWEQWDTTSTGTPGSWSRTEDLLIAEEGDDFGFTWVTKVDGQSGSGIKLNNQKIDNDIVVGALLSHNNFDNFLKPSFKVDKQWKYIEGYYNFDSDQGDSAQITVPMYYLGNLVGGVDFKIGKETSEWTYFAMPLAYFFPTVDSATIVIACADFDNAKGANTSLSLDQLRFADWTASVDKPMITRLEVYPNPSRDYVQVSFENEGTSSIKLMDAQGRIVYNEQTELSENRIDISTLKGGLYQIIIENDQYRTSKKLIKHE